MTAALLIGGVQAVHSFQHVRSIDFMLNVLLTDTLAWFAVLYLTAGIVLTLEHGAQQTPGAHG